MVNKIDSKPWLNRRTIIIFSITIVLLLAFILGLFASVQLLVLILAIIGAFVLLNRPYLGLLLAIVIALFARQQIGTGSEVDLTAVTFYIPILGGIWFLGKVGKGSIRLAPSRANLPLLLFVILSLLSLFIGIATWDLSVPRNENFFLVQLSQWGIFALSALALWMTADLIKNEMQLQEFTWTFLWLAGTLAILSVTIGTNSLAEEIVTVTLTRSPFWLLLTSLAAGQLLFNNNLSSWRRIFLALIVFAVIIYAFIQQRDSISNWVGVGAALAVLFWLRFPRWRWIAIFLILVALLSGILLSTIYNFAGGDAEWQISGASRLVLVERVIEVTMRNPITGLGPAAYRPYTSMQPLPYGFMVWTTPQVNSHNNWVDLFSHSGFVGVGLFLWFGFEIFRSAWIVSDRTKNGFSKGFANGMIGAWIGALLIMMLADWILPFVYNIGFEGFPASVLIWFFLGGIVALENMALGPGI